MDIILQGTSVWGLHSAICCFANGLKSLRAIMTNLEGYFYASASYMFKILPQFLTNVKSGMNNNKKNR